MCGGVLGGSCTGGVMYNYLTYNSLVKKTYGTLIGRDNFHKETREPSFASKNKT
jgi:uridine kinase